jgi:hypothetical protein
MLSAHLDVEIPHFASEPRPNRGSVQPTDVVLRGVRCKSGGRVHWLTRAHSRASLLLWIHRDQRTEALPAGPDSTSSLFSVLRIVATLGPMVLF